MAAMPMMMPMMMPMPMAYGMPAFAQPSQQVQTPTGNCGDCSPRVERLEKGVAMLSERMDKIESILDSQSKVLVALKESMDKANAAK